jgi:hypothetical protein
MDTQNGRTLQNVKGGKDLLHIKRSDYIVTYENRSGEVEADVYVSQWYCVSFSHKAFILLVKDRDTKATYSIFQHVT